jgi:peptidoglycan/LPS O-acetylase OafA/YrhL
MESPDQVHTPSGSGSYLFHESANLDFLRSTAVLLVFGIHWYDIQTGAGGRWGLPGQLGRLGVLMFFVHTSLVLMWSLERTHFDGWRLYASFYIRRIFRLYPLSIICVLFAYFFDLRWQPVNLWQNLTLTQNLFFRNETSFPPTITPIWSLPLEVEMYVVLPLLFLIFRKRSLKLLIGTWAIAVALAFVQPALGERFLIFRYVPCFLGGIIAWRIIREHYQAWLSPWLWPLAIAMISMIAVETNQRFLPLSIATFGLCLGLAIPLFREIQSTAVKTVSKVIARYSYGIYLTHFPIMLYVMRDERDPWFKVIHQMPRLKHFARPVDLILVVVFTSLAALGLYHLIESPGIHLGQRVARWTTSRTNDC